MQQIFYFLFWIIHSSHCVEERQKIFRQKYCWFHEIFAKKAWEKNSPISTLWFMKRDIFVNLSILRIFLREIINRWNYVKRVFKACIRLK